MQILSLLAILLSITLFFPFPTEVCGSSCEETVISVVMSYLGIFYFSIIAVFGYRRERWFQWFLSLGFGGHLGLYSYTVLAGYPCRICLVILLIHCTVFAIYMWKHLNKNTRSVMACTSVIAAIGGFLLLSFLEAPDNSKLLNIALANKADVVEIGDVEKTIKQNSSSQSKEIINNPIDNEEQAGGSTRVKPPIYLVQDLEKGYQVVDISKKPLVFWYTHCGHCEQILANPGDKVQYVAVWLDEPEQDLPLAKEMAGRFGVESLYTIDVRKLEVESVPAMVLWDEAVEEPEIIFGATKIVNKINSVNLGEW